MEPTIILLNQTNVSNVFEKIQQDFEITDAELAKIMYISLIELEDIKTGTSISLKNIFTLSKMLQEPFENILSYFIEYNNGAYRFSTNHGTTVDTLEHELKSYIRSDYLRAWRTFRILRKMGG